MTFANHRFLTDENIDPRIVASLRARGLDIWDVREMGWSSEEDRNLLSRATADGRVILTHDVDFGHLVVFEGLPCCGIVRMKPGHLPYVDYLDMVEELIRQQTPLVSPFLVTLTKTSTRITIRIRTL